MPPVHARALKRAAELLGGIEPFARHVGVPAHELVAWMNGEGMPPLGVFLKAVDIISERQAADLGAASESALGAQASADAQASESLPHFGDGRLRMLVIDDHPEIRYIAGKRLREMGHIVYEAADGATGLQLARAHRPDVILVDIVLPDMQGYDVARELRTEFGRTALIAAVTAFRELEPGASLEAGFDQHFHSPIEPAALQSWLGGTLADA